MLQFLRPAPAMRRADPRAVEPTPTLRFVAGPHADAVARVWPAPHGAYLVMPAQRRHLTHLVLATSTAPASRLAAALEGARADAVARDFLGPVPVGFLKALSRLGEAPWASEDYLQLLSLFEDEDAAAVLRQSPVITPAVAAALAALSPPLRAAAIVRHTGAGAGLLDEAYRAIRAVRGEDAAAVAVSRWARAVDAQRLFAMAADALSPVQFDLAPFPAHEDLRLLDGVAALNDAGRRFRNCLAGYGESAAEGYMALYEWAGPPPAALALRRDGFFGWRLDQARGVGNALLDADARVRLTALLRGLGVRVGYGGRALADRLRRAGGLDHRWIDDAETPDGAFVD